MITKRLFLVVAMAFSGALFLVIVYDALHFVDVRSWTYWAKIIGFFGLYAGWAALTAMLTGKQDYAIAMTVIAVLYWVIFGFNGITAATGVIFLFLNMLYAVTVSKEAEERLKISFSKIISKNLHLFILSLIALLTAGYYFLPSVQARAQLIEIPPTIEAAAEKLAFDVILRAAPELKEQIEQTPGAKEQLTTEVEGIMDRLLAQANHFAKPYLKYFPIVLAAGFFLALSALMWTWQGITVLFAGIMFTVLKATGFVKIETVEKPVEVIKI